MTKEDRDLVEMSTFDLECLQEETLLKSKEKSDKIQRILNSRQAYPYSSKQEEALLKEVCCSWNEV